MDVKVTGLKSIVFALRSELMKWYLITHTCSRAIIYPIRGHKIPKICSIMNVTHPVNTITVGFIVRSLTGFYGVSVSPSHI